MFKLCKYNFIMDKLERFNWKRTIQVNIFLLRILGLWPAGDGSYKCSPYTFYEMFVLLFFEIGHISVQTVNIFLILNNLQALTGTIFVSLMEMLGVLKSYCLIKNMGKLKQLLITLNSDLFQPKDLQQRNLIRPNLNAWTTVVSSFWFLTLIWLFFYNFSPILDKTSKEYRLPFWAWYPYNTETSPQYELTYLHQFIGITYLTMINVNIDTLIAALNMYIGAQFDIICDNVRHFHNHETDTSADANKKIKHCIHHHREVLKFAEFTNNFYNWLIFLEFFVGGVSIGLAMFQLTVVSVDESGSKSVLIIIFIKVVPFSGEFLSYLIYSNCISVQVFMYCWFGNEIEVKSSNLPDAIFDSDWTSLPTEVKRNLIIFLIRVQRPLKMSAFGLFYLSLETFVKIMRTAWSYFALLRQVNSPK
ncbi:7tm 6 domain containing protein [Asbolus verrucosus]|uniref:Odorant receptor n=1 Tax=Asbolus verrucosus TaxID=1661398 RepID=A0A482VCH0_ASBVE|nr:7tm 6 domain containing protein [Asbolus verrucosus]